MEKPTVSMGDALNYENIIGIEKLRENIDFVFGKIANSVGKTLGPGGGLTILTATDSTAPVYPTKDGFTVVQEYKFNDQIKYFIAELIKDIPRRMNNEVGDGTTSGLIIGYKLYDLLSNYNLVERHPEIGCELSGSSIRLILEEVREALFVELNKDSNYILRNKDIEKEVEDRLIKKISTISANNNPDIGDLVAELFTKRASNEIYITNEVNRGNDTVVEHEAGFEFGGGFTMPVMANMPDRITCKFTNPRFLICDGPLTENDITNLNRIIDHVIYNLQRPLVIIAKDYDHAVNQLIGARCTRTVEPDQFTGQIVEHPKEDIACLVVNAENERSLERIEDLRIILGCEIVTTKKGKIQDFKSDFALMDAYLGEAKEFLGTQLSTRVKGGRGNKESIMLQIKHIEERISELETNENILSFVSVEQHRKRIAMLNSDMTIIRVGGANDKEKRARKLIFDDAIAACKSAIIHGFTLGGNVCVVDYLGRNRAEFTEMIANKLIAENKHITFRNTKEHVLSVVSDIVDIIAVSFKAAYFVAVENMVGKNTPIFNQIIDEVYNDKSSTTPLVIDLVSGETSSIKSENPSPIVPGNTDTELMYAIFGSVGNLISSNQLLTVFPGDATLFNGKRA